MLKVEVTKNFNPHFLSLFDETENKQQEKIQEKGFQSSFSESIR